MLVDRGPPRHAFPDQSGIVADAWNPHMKAFRSFRFGPGLALLLCVLLSPAYALEYSRTELHLQYGNLAVPTFAGGGNAYHLIYTLQHASGWQYGDNYFFVDVRDAQNREFQDLDAYGEWYENFSLGKITGRKIGVGIISDVGLVLGFNWAPELKIKKYLYGLRLSFDLDGFTFANLDVTTYIDDSAGVSSGGVPSEGDSFMMDFKFMRPFTIGEASFSIQGHVEYIDGRKNEFGDTVESWILAQPQLRWNLHERFALGIEYQFWLNKLGDGPTDENTVQALLVWKFW